MLDMFFKGGNPMWPLLFLLIIIFILSIKKTTELYKKNGLELKRIRSGINTIIFCGCFSVFLGFLGHFWGLYMALKDIGRANDISPVIVAEGYAVSLISIIFGIVIFLFSSIIWYLLRWKYKILEIRGN